MEIKPFFTEISDLILEIFEHSKNFENPKELGEQAILEFASDHCPPLSMEYFYANVKWCKDHIGGKEYERYTGFLDCEAHPCGIVIIRPMGGKGWLWFFPNRYVHYQRHDYA